MSRRRLQVELARYMQDSGNLTRARHESTMLQLLGVLPENTDLGTEALRTAGTGLLGFYDPLQRTLFVAADLPQQATATAIAHERIHAQQDARYGLGAALSVSAGNGDRAAARLALAEGEAILATSSGLPDIHTLRPQLEAALSTAVPPPPILLRAIVEPYVAGVSFIQQAQARGWTVQHLWMHPPQSTEQLMHFEKYETGEAFATPEPAAGPDGACSSVFWDTFGEAAVRNVLLDWASPQLAATAASGWNGDRLDLFECGGAPALTWRILLDSERDSAELASALRVEFPHCDTDSVVLITEQPDAVTVWAMRATCAQLESWAHQPR